MIFQNEKEITGISFGTLSIDEVYQGKLLVWQAVRSCFGSGYWVDDLPWINEDGWKN